MLLLTFVVVSSPLHMDYELIEASARFDEEYPDKTSLSWPVVKECEANFTIISAKSMGEPIFFSAPGLDFIPTLTDLTITIPVLDRCVQDSKILHTSKYETDFWFMSTRGVPGDFTTKFKIVKLQGDIYSFEFCPSHPVGVICTREKVNIYSNSNRLSKSLRK
ncbi:hypothetical protein P8452_29045 [Trifolium repens]|nr:hypothetical protein P8452_29045 [Trifolium repens]